LQLQKTKKKCKRVRELYETHPVYRMYVQTAHTQVRGADFQPCYFHDNSELLRKAQ